MRRNPFFTLGTLFVGLLFLTTSCMKDKTLVTTTYKVNQPLYLADDDHRAVEFQTSRSLVNPGKMYVYGNTLLINEKGAGLHMFDNSDPANPIAIGFMQIPGNLDVAVKDGVVYADSYSDLLTLQLNGSSLEILERFEDVFNYDFYSWDFDPAYPLGNIDHSKGIVVGWVLQEVTEECEGDDCPGISNGGWGFNTFERNDQAIALNDFAGVNEAGGGGGSNIVGVGGSLARFKIYDQYLYTISSMREITIYNIAAPASPQREGTFDAGNDIETLFTNDHYLFIGAQTGMYIYDLSSPTSPEYVSTFLHIRSCDPVVVHGDYAYVTLRGGGRCGQANNELDVIDISDMANPRLVAVHPMNGPFGLGVDPIRNVLFVCDGDAGLKIYDIENPLTLIDNRIAQFIELNAYDVIPLFGQFEIYPSGVLLMIGEDGFIQYNYSDLENITEISRIPVVAI